MWVEELDSHVVNACMCVCPEGWEPIFFVLHNSRDILGSIKIVVCARLLPVASLAFCHCAPFQYSFGPFSSFQNEKLFLPGRLFAPFCRVYFVRARTHTHKGTFLRAWTGAIIMSKFCGRWGGGGGGGLKNPFPDGDPVYRIYSSSPPSPPLPSPTPSSQAPDLWGKGVTVNHSVITSRGAKPCRLL